MDFRMKVKVNPGSSQQKLIWRGDFLKVNLTAPPEEGAANRQLIELIADNFDLKNDDVELIRGETSENKTVMLHNLNRETLVRKMNDLKG
ncbi:MAG: DUF167 domain-containing protein [bacterium]